ncbi:MAG: HlyD family efflux transporter periplasmic adaptor subunit [Acidobacteriota bacterium]
MLPKPSSTSPSSLGTSPSSLPLAPLLPVALLMALAAGATGPAWRRRLLWVAALVVVLLLVGVLLRPSSQPVDLVVAERGSLAVLLAEEGETRVRDRFVVSAPLAGQVLRIDLEPGDEVKAGETILATFEPQAPGLLDARSRAQAQGRLSAAQARLGSSRAELARAEEDLAFQQSETERLERLAGEGVVSTEDLDRGRRLLATQREAVLAARFQRQAAQHDLEVARAALLQSEGRGAGAEPLQLTSPVDGVVLQRFRESAAIVPAGEALLEVGDSSVLEVVADYLSTDAVRILPGQRALLERWGGEEALEARVRRVEPSGFLKISALGVEEQRVNVIFDIESPRERWLGLGDGFRVEVRTEVWAEDDVLQLPLGCLLRNEGQWSVYREEEGIARLTTVELGHRGATHAEILSGLEAGAKVLLHPGDTVADGVRVVDRRPADG